MSESGFFMTDPDGLPDGFVDDSVLYARALRIAGSIALVSDDSSAVEALIRDELVHNDLPLMLKQVLALHVIEEFATELFAPLLRATRLEHPDTDFPAQVRSRTGLDS